MIPQKPIEMTIITREMKAPLIPSFLRPKNEKKDSVNINLESQQLTKINTFEIILTDTLSSGVFYSINIVFLVYSNNLGSTLTANAIQRSSKNVRKN